MLKLPYNGVYIESEYPKDISPPFTVTYELDRPGQIVLGKIPGDILISDEVFEKQIFHYNYSHSVHDDHYYLLEKVTHE